MPTRVLWEGPFFANHSLALVNREIVWHLSQRPELDLSIRSGETETGFTWDADRVARLRALEAEHPESTDVDVCIRHRWPPDLHQPPAGKWVIMQPWEYGSLPRRWYEPMKFEADEIWVYSSFNKECYVESGIPEDRIHVVPLGVHPAMFTPAGRYPLESRKRFRFLFVGGTIMRKGIDLLIDAYIRAFTPADDVCLVIKDFGVGTFYRHQTYERFIRELQGSGRAPAIEYLADELTPDQLRDLYNACDCLVHPYRGEGFGLPIAEAMACGLPVIVPDAGGASDFCTPETALLVPSRRKPVPDSWATGLDTIGRPWWLETDPRALGERMREVYANPSAVHDVAQRGQNLVRARFTWEAAAETVRGRLCSLADPVRMPKVRDSAAQYLERMREGKERWERKEPLRALRNFAQAGEHQRGPDALFNIASVLITEGDLRTAVGVLDELAGHLGESDAPAERALLEEVGATATACRTELRAATLTRGGPVRVRWSAPIFNASGYASESRAFLAGLLDSERWAVDLVPQDPIKDHGIMAPKLFHTLRRLTAQRSDTSHIDFQHGPAHGFTRPTSGVSVCRTMLETDRIPTDWAEACNRFTEVWVPTAFNRETFARSGVLREKIRVVPGAIDAQAYDRSRYPERRITGAKTFRFLSVFDFTPRKGWDILLRAYFEEFSAREDVSLVVKVVNFFAGEKGPDARIREFIQEHGYTETPHVVLIDRACSDDELRQLYAGCDAFVLPSRGEGWGRPYMEAMAFGLPTIGTRWSGNLEFMNDNNSFLIDIEGLEPCERTWSTMPLYEGHHWAVPSVRSLRELMRAVYRHQEEARDRGARARLDILAQYDVPVVAQLFRKELDRLIDAV